MFILGKRFLETRWFWKNKPFAASFALTRRCNYQCLYCGTPKIKEKELPAKDIFWIIDALRKCGVLRVVFTGGEPLLRKDIGDIINYAKNRKLAVYVNTNGSLVPDKIGQLKPVDGLQISLEGPLEIHDYIRGKGSYRQVIEALKAAKKEGIRTIIASTLNKLTVEKVEYILEIARKFDSMASFQPLTFTLLDINEPNPLLPSLASYRKAINRLIALKRRGSPYIYNSLMGLKYFYKWPDTPQLLCSAGKLFFRIEADGRIFSCSRFQPPWQGRYIRPDFDLCKMIRNLNSVSCRKCWCVGEVEANLVFSLKLEPMLNLIKMKII